MGWPSTGFAMWLWPVAMTLFVVGAVLLVLWAIGAAAGRRDDEPAEILRARFARGEIGADQFAAATQMLASSESRPSPSRATLLAGAGLLLAGLLAWAVASASYGGFGGMMGPRMMGMMGPAPTAPGGTSVTMAGSRFAPPTLSTRVGEAVRWFNDDAVPHTVTAAGRSWDSGNLPPGSSFERRFDAPGTYPYVCLYHPWMTGSIVVTGP